MTGSIHTEIRGAAGWLRIVNPPKRNALDADMIATLAREVRRLDAHEDVSALVIRGDGTEAFAAGADISGFEVQRNSAEAQRAYDDAVESLFDALRVAHTPIIAMIHGWCFGAGVAIALAADIRYGDERSVFSIPAARLGIGYPVPLTHALAAVVGPAHAAEMLFTGQRLTADEALRIGLLNRVVAADRLGDDVAELADVIARSAPLSIRAAKLAVRAFVDPSALASAQAAVAACADSADAGEGPRAFREKRAPRFEGR